MRSLYLQLWSSVAFEMCKPNRRHRSALHPVRLGMGFLTKWKNGRERLLLHSRGKRSVAAHQSAPETKPKPPSGSHRTAYVIAHQKLWEPELASDRGINVRTLDSKARFGVEGARGGVT